VRYHVPALATSIALLLFFAQTVTRADELSANTQTNMPAVGQPQAPVHAVTETIQGVSVSDPYRWLEDLKDPKVQAWFKGQNDYTRALLARLPGRAALAKRVDALSGADTIVFDVVNAGPRWFYRKRGPGDADYRLYVRDGLSGPERVLVDPVAMGTGGVHYSLSYYRPSNDGVLVAYGVSPGGSEDATIKIVDAASGKVLDETIDRGELGESDGIKLIYWLPDNKSFLYPRLQKLAPGAPATDKYKKTLIYRHVIGTHPRGDGDSAVFGSGVTPRAPVSDEEIGYLVWSPASTYVVGVVQKFVKSELTLYTAPLASLDGAKTPWRQVVNEQDGVTDFDVHDDDIFLLSHHDASRFKVVRTSLSKPDFAAATSIVPAGSALITGIAAARDALYVQQIDGGLARLQRVPFDAGAKPRELKLPYDGSLSEFVTDPQKRGALMKMTSWTQPQLWYAYDPASDKFGDTKLRPRSAVDYSAIVSEEVKVKSHDGTLVPLSIVHRRDLSRNGRNPTLLVAYGSYGIRIDPSFDPIRLAWLERGGILAVAHVRGGGEYGEDWHLAGQKLTKPNTWKDFIACGEYLIEQKWTSTALLAGEGGSAGGITVGRALTERPDLFAAIIDDVGMSDLMRYETTANGPPNVPEFGSIGDA
jgi:prolyl oligopeptidase